MRDSVTVRRMLAVLALVAGFALTSAGCASTEVRPSATPPSYRLTAEQESQLAAIADAMTGKERAPKAEAATPGVSGEEKAERPESEAASPRQKPGPLEAEAPVGKVEIREETCGPSLSLERPVTLLADQVPLGLVLQQLASSGRLELELGRGVRPNAPVSVEIRGLPLRQALHTVLDPIGYGFRLSDKSVKVVAIESRRIRMSFLNLLRSVGVHIGGETPGSIRQTATTVATVGAADTTARTFGLNRFWGDVIARFDVHQADPWGDLENTLKEIVGEDGTFAMNRTSGVVMVTGPPDMVDRATDFLEAVNRELSKMVHLDVTSVPPGPSRTPERPREPADSHREGPEGGDGGPGPRGGGRGPDAQPAEVHRPQRAERPDHRR